MANMGRPIERNPLGVGPVCTGPLSAVCRLIEITSNFGCLSTALAPPAEAGTAESSWLASLNVNVPATGLPPVVSLIWLMVAGLIGSLNRIWTGALVGTCVSVFSGLVLMTVGGLVFALNDVVKL